MPPGRERVAERLRSWLPRSRPHAAQWLGLEPKGEPRYVFVEDYDGMRREASPGVPDWAVAVARPDDVIVFRLDRIDRHPTRRLELVADHEVIHQLLNHLGGERLPRWFEEGLCSAYAGVPFLEPKSSLELAAAAGTLPTLEETRMLFYGDGGDASRAYEVSERAVRYLLSTRGPESMRAILRAVASGAPFTDAFASGAGISLEAFEKEWRASVTPRVPFVVYLLFENLELALLCFGALAVFFGWLRWRRRRERAMASLESGSAHLTRQALATLPPGSESNPSDDR